MEIDRRQLRDEEYRLEVFNTLMRDHRDAIIKYCSVVLGETLAEEVAQDVFVIAWEKLPKFKPTAPIDHWLLRIAKLKCKQELRNAARRHAIVRASRGDIRRRVHAEALGLPEELMVSEEEFARLSENLAKLGEMDFMLLNLRYRKELSVPEIVEVLGKSEATVRKRLDRAMQRLREMMRHVTER